MPAANWMKKRREALGITQDQVVERLMKHGIHLTKAAISKWELGKSALPLSAPEYRRAIADALEMTIPELLATAGYELGDAWSAQAQYVATMFDTLSENDQQTIMALIAHLKSQQEARQETLAPILDGASKVG